MLVHRRVTPVACYRYLALVHVRLTLRPPRSIRFSDVFETDDAFSLGPRDPRKERQCQALVATDPLIFRPSEGKSEALTTTPQRLRTDSHILYL